MKRSGELHRKAPPIRKVGLQAKEEANRAWRARSRGLRRKKPKDGIARGSSAIGKGVLPPISAKRAAERPERARVRTAVFERDGYRCRLSGIPDAGPCFGPPTPHHRRKDGQQGGYTMANLVTLCAGHNDGIESDADLAALAYGMGLVVLRGDPGYDALGRPS